MEKLYAECLLWALGLRSGDEYAALLHQQFRTQPEDSLLFQLEECATDAGRSLAQLERAVAQNEGAFCRQTFAHRLFAGLQTAYAEIPLPDLGKKCYRLWQALPESLQKEQPFLTLQYAEDSLSWGDEAGMRAHLEQAFATAGCQARASAPPPCTPPSPMV